MTEKKPASDPATSETPQMIVKEVKKKNKKRYSKGLKRYQKNREHMTRASYRIANAVAKGIDKYRDKQDKAARKKKDGALRERIPNLASGASKSVRLASRALKDVGKMYKSKRRNKFRKRLYKSLNFRW